MDVGRSVKKAIDDWEQGDLESSMLHACNAVDGTAGKASPGEASGNKRFTDLLRENYAILGPMCAPGIDLVHTRFPVSVPRPKAPGGQADLADVIYGIHRCVHGHGGALPQGFELIPDASGPAGFTKLRVMNGTVQLSDRTIFGLLAVAVMAPANVGQRVPDAYYLTYGSDSDVILHINDWWGYADDFRAAVAPDGSKLQVKLDFTDWMDGK